MKNFKYFIMAPMTLTVLAFTVVLVHLTFYSSRSEAQAPKSKIVESRTEKLDSKLGTYFSSVTVGMYVSAEFCEAAGGDYNDDRKLCEKNEPMGNQIYLRRNTSGKIIASVSSMDSRMRMVDFDGILVKAKGQSLWFREVDFADDSGDSIDMVIQDGCLLRINFDGKKATVVPGKKCNKALAISAAQ